MSAESIAFGPPRGMRDFYPEEAAARERIFEAWREAARRFGFVQYDACVVESLDLLRRKAGEEIVDQIYAFTDKSDRELALRPEMTPTLARMVAERQGTLRLPLKWFAIAQCFRYERMTRGRKREHFQWNLDIVGEPSVAAEAEVLATAAEALSLLGLGPGDVRIHVNSRALLGDLLARLGIAREQHGAAFLALDKRGKISDEEVRAMLVAGGLDAPAADRVLGLAQMKSMDDVEAVLGGRTEALDALCRFLDLMQRYGLRDRVVFDVSVIRGLAYYTGLVFEAFDAERQFRAIFGGGRYDNLLNDIGGRPETAVGLGFGDVVVAELLADKGKLQARPAAAEIAVSFMTADQQNAAVSVATAFRRAGRTVDLALHPEKAKGFFSRADRDGCRKAVYIGPDDLAAGTIRVKSLAERAEECVRLADVGVG